MTGKVILMGITIKVNNNIYYANSAKATSELFRKIFTEKNIGDTIPFIIDGDNKVNVLDEGNITESNYINGNIDGFYAWVECSDNKNINVYFKSSQKCFLEYGKEIEFNIPEGKSYGVLINDINNTIPEQTQNQITRPRFENVTTTTGFENRTGLTSIVSDKLTRLFNSEAVEINKFGVENTINQESALSAYLKDLRNMENSTAMILEFQPDYILFDKVNNRVFFLEIKVSLTPCWSDRIVSEINNRHEEIIGYDRIGEIAREPYLAYKRYYPNTIIIMGTSYNKDVLMAQFIENIKCLRCDDSNYCNDCPINSGGFFNCQNRNNNAGSGTPHTNVDLASFKEIGIFFNEIGINLNPDTINIIKNEIKSRGVSLNSQYITEDKKRTIISQLRESGCDFLS